MAPHTKAQQAQQVCSNKHGFSAKAPGIIAASAAQDRFERQLQETREREKRMLEFREYRMTQLSFHSQAQWTGFYMIMASIMKGSSIN